MKSNTFSLSAPKTASPQGAGVSAQPQGYKSARGLRAGIDADAGAAAYFLLWGFGSCGALTAASCDTLCTALVGSTARAKRVKKQLKMVKGSM